MISWLLFKMNYWYFLFSKDQQVFNLFSFQVLVMLQIKYILKKILWFWNIFQILLLFLFIFTKNNFKHNIFCLSIYVFLCFATYGLCHPCFIVWPTKYKIEHAFGKCSHFKDLLYNAYLILRMISHATLF